MVCENCEVEREKGKDDFCAQDLGDSSSRFSGYEVNLGRFKLGLSRSDIDISYRSAKKFILDIIGCHLKPQT